MVLGDFLTHHTITGGEAKCNDGSNPSYYLRSVSSSTTWVITLEAHEMCFSNSSCADRAASSPDMVSTKDDKATKFVFGLLSNSATQNPHFHDSNSVFIRYCSSDSWIGTARSGEKGNDTPYHFMGSLIIDEVLRELTDQYNLNAATNIILTGIGSAGAQGMLLNADRLSAQFKQTAPAAKVVGLSDLGWFVDQESYVPPGNCSTLHDCSPALALGYGLKIWGSLLPDACQALDQGWKCFFPEYWFQKLLTPTFSVQNVYDSGFLRGMGSPWPVDTNNVSQMAYVEKTATNFRRVMRPYDSYIPSCSTHEVVNVMGFHSKNKIGDWTVSEAFWQFFNGNWTEGSLVDSCLTLNCNPTCAKI